MLERTCKIFLIVALLLAPFSAKAELININTASASELETLNGIGPVYAQRIIDYRNTNGPFSSIEEIKNVSGIGDATYAKIEDYITVGENVAVESGESQNDTSSDVEQASAHYGSGSSSTFKERKAIKISAGRNRVAMVGTPIEFEALSENDVKSDTFKWSFGDGAVQYGKVVTHAYLYPSEYALVLSVSGADGANAVTRATVKIISADIFISAADKDRIEISNNANNEVNLFGRALYWKGNSFIFPKDSIILPKQKVSFPSKITRLIPINIADIYLLSVGDDPHKSHNSTSMLEKSRTETIAEIRSQIETLEDKLVQMRQTASIVAATQIPMSNRNQQENFTDNIIDNEDIVANALSVGNEKTQNWWTIIKKFFTRRK